MKVLIFEFRIDKDDIEQIVNINLDSKIVSNFFIINYILIILVKKLNYIKIL
jgi:hypothetical protein